LKNATVQNVTKIIKYYGSKGFKAFFGCNVIPNPDINLHDTFEIQTN